MSVSLSTSERRTEFLAGSRDVFPLIVGAVPFGIIFGAIAVTNGLTPLATIAMSMFVFAGSSQFIAAGLVGSLLAANSLTRGGLLSHSLFGFAGAPQLGTVGILIIIFTTFIVNLRHALYSATLAPHTRHLSQRWLLILGFTLTDEAFAVAVRRYDKTDQSPYKHYYFFGAAISLYIMWQISTVVGLVAGQAIPQDKVGALGLDFAAIVAFTGMVVPVVKTRPIFFAVVVAGLCSVLFYNLPGKLGLIVAAFAGIGAGMFAENQMPKRAVRIDSSQPAPDALNAQPDHLPRESGGH